jgi:hypothetical protein
MTKLRIRKEDRQRLKELQEQEKVREMAIEAGLIEEDDPLSYEKLVELILPEDEVVYDREMAWITVHSKREEVLEMAGNNVSAHHVIHELTQQFIEENDLGGCDG